VTNEGHNDPLDLAFFSMSSSHQVVSLSRLIYLTTSRKHGFCLELSKALAPVGLRTQTKGVP
jgi:hypothetical protein